VAIDRFLVKREKILIARNSNKRDGRIGRLIILEEEGGSVSNKANRETTALLRS